jgi:hypothetical protein
MIDPKVIEKLSHLDDATILRRLPDSERTFFEYGFQLGYNRALKDLWHPNTEEPDKSKSDIITIGSYNYISLHFKETILWKEESWRHSINRCQIIKWAYLSDILPKKGGKE